MSEEIEGRVTEKLSQEFTRTERRILGALSKLKEVLLKPQVRVHPGYVPETSRNRIRENQEPTEDRSQNDFYPEARVPLSQFSQDCCSDDTYDSLAGFIEQIWEVRQEALQLCHDRP